jgi:DNA-binding transcriptional regulator GbsR (MarR family)
MENAGASKTLGRIFGYLLLADQPRSLDEIARDLLFSKATASLTIRQGLAMRIFEKVSLPGERKSYYRANVQSWIKASMEKARAMKVWEKAIDRGLGFVSHNRESRENLKELKDYFNFVNWYLSDIEIQYERWKKGEIDESSEKP